MRDDWRKAVLRKAGSSDPLILGLSDDAAKANDNDEY